MTNLVLLSINLVTNHYISEFRLNEKDNFYSEIRKGTINTNYNIELTNGIKLFTVAILSEYMELSTNSTKIEQIK